MAEIPYMRIRGASEHNLKNIDIDIPKNKLVVLTRISGSGKSSLAFDTIYADGQRRYMESLSSYARMFMGQRIISLILDRKAERAEERLLPRELRRK
jgi:excinuclease ABC subunit A